jgi:hypothetical protein
MAEKQTPAKNKLQQSAPPGREQETKTQRSVTGAGETSVNAQRPSQSQDPDDGRSDAVKNVKDL